MDYTYTFSRLEPCYNDRNKTGVCHLVVGLSCYCSGQFNGMDICESAYVDKMFEFDQFISYDNLTGNLETYANDFATQEGWWELLKTRVSGKIDKPINGGNIAQNESLTITANPVE